VANADQVRALLDSFVEGDEQRFFSVAMQVAANEARLGHGKLAEELRDAIDAAKRRKAAGRLVPIGRPRGELANLLSVSYPTTRLNHMILGRELNAQIQRVVEEQKHAGRILDHGLSPRRKLLLVGPPGTGKTMTAAALAGELGIPLFLVRLDGLLTKFMGEAAAKLRQIFEATGNTRGVYFFDEFDAIGSQRGLGNDVGEIRRVLNSFLQMIEQDRSHSLVLAATNHPDLLDVALVRRFDDVLHYELPTKAQISQLLSSRLSRQAPKGTPWPSLASSGAGLSHAEIARAAEEALKETLIRDQGPVRASQIRLMLKERKSVAQRMRKKS
jgi:SpoVK/Ycf46/Vps4 family AAA+-type ATPase